MLYKNILIFATITVVVIIAFIAFAKNLSQSFNSINKKTALSLFFISLLNAIIAFGITYLNDDPFFDFCTFSFIFLVFGIIHLLVIHDKFLVINSENKYTVAFGEMIFSIAIMLSVVLLISLLEFFIKDKSFLFVPVLLSVITFIVPLFFYYTFEAAVNIPETDFIVWEYPVLKRIDPPDESANDNLLVIGFNISKKIFEKKTVFRARAPENIILGELFYHFINEYNDDKSGTPIEFLDENKEPIVWWFRLKRKWYHFNKVLNPNVRIRDNFIKENAVIICEQLIRKPIK